MERPPTLVLERYRLERRLGTGGFGTVWEAWDERLERYVAVKVVPREGADRRADREARAVARLNHPSIVALYELAADEDEAYLVSELVRGRTLAELIAAGALADRDVALIGGDLCEALDHAHTRGVVHRDVKPANVIVVSQPAAGMGFAKLTDFGVAQLAGGDPLTRTGDVVGTLAYMAPEQAEGGAAVPASDVYSLALTLYEAWTGSNPVRGRGAAATARRLGRPLPSLGSKRRDLPPELCDVIDRALDRDPRVRPAPLELGAALRTTAPELPVEGGLVEPETIDRMGLTAVRRRPPTGAGAVVARLAAGSAAGLLVLLALTQLSPEPPISPMGAAGAVAAVVALLPRAGWIGSALALCGWLASPEAGREGTALLLAAALLPTPLLLSRTGLAWSLPALAPLLGMAALAPAFVGVAALARTAAQRAGLATAGFLWLVAAEALTGEGLLLGAADGSLPRSDWEHSLTGAAADALYPLLSSPALAPVTVWALFAVTLPLLVRGRVLALDLLGAAAWAAGLAAAHAAIGDLVAASSALESPRGAIAGALVAALAALSAAWARPAAEPPLESDDAGTATPAQELL